MAVNYPPHTPRREFPKSIFLAGTIEKGNSEDWQTKVTEELSGSYDVFNPRRGDWDNSWEQSIGNPVFFGQVSWELENLENADVVLFYFDPNSKSPISLLELGICSQLGKEIIVVCPDGFWRQGNVDIVVSRYNLKRFRKIEEALSYLTG